MRWVFADEQVEEGGEMTKPWGTPSWTGREKDRWHFCRHLADLPWR